MLIPKNYGKQCETHVFGLGGLPSMDILRLVAVFLLIVAVGLIMTSGAPSPGWERMPSAGTWCSSIGITVRTGSAEIFCFLMRPLVSLIIIALSVGTGLIWLAPRAGELPRPHS